MRQHMKVITEALKAPAPAGKTVTPAKHEGMNVVRAPRVAVLRESSGRVKKARAGNKVFEAASKPPVINEKSRRHYAYDLDNKGAIYTTIANDPSLRLVNLQKQGRSGKEGYDRYATFNLQTQHYDGVIRLLRHRTMPPGSSPDYWEILMPYASVLDIETFEMSPRASYQQLMAKIKQIFKAADKSAEMSDAEMKRTFSDLEFEENKNNDPKPRLAERITGKKWARTPVNEGDEYEQMKRDIEASGMKWQEVLCQGCQQTLTVMPVDHSGNSVISSGWHDACFQSKNEGVADSNNKIVTERIMLDDKGEIDDPEWIHKQGKDRAERFGHQDAQMFSRVADVLLTDAVKQVAEMGFKSPDQALFALKAKMNDLRDIGLGEITDTAVREWAADKIREMWSVPDYQFDDAAYDGPKYKMYTREGDAAVAYMVSKANIGAATDIENYVRTELELIALDYPEAADEAVVKHVAAELANMNPGAGLLPPPETNPDDTMPAVNDINDIDPAPELEPAAVDAMSPPDLMPADIDASIDAALEPNADEIMADEPAVVVDPADAPEVAVQPEVAPAPNVPQPEFAQDDIMDVVPESVVKEALAKVLGKPA